MDAQTKSILDAVAIVIKDERKRTTRLIENALPADHRAIPALAVATIKLQKSDIREYANNLLHRNSKVVGVKQVTAPFYVRQIDS